MISNTERLFKTGSIGVMRDIRFKASEVIDIERIIRLSPTDVMSLMSRILLFGRETT